MNLLKHFEWFSKGIQSNKLSSKPQTNCQCSNYFERDIDLREGGHPHWRQTICLSDSTYLCDTIRQQRAVRLASMKGSMCSIRAWVLLMMNWLTHAMAWDLQHNNHQLGATQAFYPHMLHAMNAAPVFFLAVLLCCCKLTYNYEELLSSVNRPVALWQADISTVQLMQKNHRKGEGGAKIQRCK